MKSLRTRRPTPSTAPQPRPQKLSKGSKDARKSRVDDKMKRRMSARYADISDPRADVVPDMPDLRDLRRIAAASGGPGGVRTFDDEDEEDVPGAGEEPRVDVLDVRDLEQEEFDPDAYLKSKLASSTEAELRAFQTSLQTTKDATALDLQKNVFKNYSDFVVISKEISTLENDMLELKASLQEWKNMPTLLTLDQPTGSTGESSNVTDTRRRTARSSIADLRTLYVSQLQTLHTTIEGSATLVPTIPGRHIIAEASDLQQLNAATYRPEHGAHIVLLDDSLLVARRRRGRLVADRSWALGEISLVDVRDTAELQNVFKIKRGQDTLVYKTERLSDKRALLTQFRQAAEELATKKRKEREGEHEKRRSMWTAGDRKSMVFDSMPALPAWMAELAAGSGGAAAKAEQDEKWINNFIDDLTVSVAMRDWDAAVELVVKGQSRTAMMPGLSSKLNPLADQLTTELLGALADPTQKRSSTIKLVAYIVKLGPDALLRARDTFLNARALLARKRVRAIRFEGDVRSYVKELALIVFTSIKHTADWYLASFKDFEMASGLIRWAKEQVEEFAKMFCVQVYGSDSNSHEDAEVEDTAVAQECIQIAKNQNKRLLRDIGMDFSFVLLDLISLPSPDAALETRTLPIPDITLPETPTESVPPLSSQAAVMSHFAFTFIAVLGLCGLASAWTFDFPKSISEGQRLWFDITGDNHASYPPYLFQVWARPPYGSASLAIQFIAPPPPSRFDWNNTQPAGTFILFQLADAAGHAARSDSFQVAPSRATQTVVQTVVATVLAGGETISILATSSASVLEGTQIKPRTNTAVIAGASVGGILFIAAIAAGALIFVRRRKPSRSLEKADLDASHVTVVPFVYDPPQSSRSTQPEREGGPSGSSVEPYDAPPSYSPPVTSVSPYDSPYTSPRPSTSENRIFMDRKGVYVPVSTVDR